MRFRCVLSIVLFWALAAVPVSAASPVRQRFFHSGDGVLHLASEKNRHTFNGRYRNADGSYRPDAIKAIAAVFDAPYDPTRQVVSLRLIEYLDFLEDRLHPGALVTLTSGYRAPQYNTNLRKNGALAAKASLHQYGMAADLVMAGVPARRIWKTVRELGFGGAGYYHGRTVHVDVGPARFWDEKSSGVGTGLSDDNKLIGLTSDFDVYRPGETIVLRFIRMTAFPIGVRSQFRLISAGQTATGDAGRTFDMPFAAADGCAEFSDIAQMAAFRWQLPPSTAPGSYRIEATFCDSRWERMPPSVVSPPFTIRQP